MNKSSCEVSGEIKEGKSGYDRKKTQMMLSGKATTMLQPSTATAVDSHKKGLNSALPAISRGHNVGVRERKENTDSSIFVSDLVSDTDLQIDSDEVEDSDEDENANEDQSSNQESSEVNASNSIDEESKQN